MAFPLRLGILRAVYKELKVESHDDRPLAVGGALADVLRKELVRDGSPDAVRVGTPDGAALYVHVLGGAATPDDEAALKRARRARVPIVAVVAGPAPDDLRVPYVQATDLVRVPAGTGFPVDEIARVIARKLGEDATHLAARLPVLRRAVAAQLIEFFARRNALIAAAIFIPGADLPVLLVNELRLVLRISAAYGEESGRGRLPEASATVAAAFGLRAVGRELLDLVPVAGWALKAVVAYAGTRALGEAAVRAAELRHPAGQPKTPLAVSPSGRAGSAGSSV